MLTTDNSAGTVSFNTHTTSRQEGPLSVLPYTRRHPSPERFSHLFKVIRWVNGVAAIFPPGVCYRALITSRAFPV